MEKSKRRAPSMTSMSMKILLFFEFSFLAQSLILPNPLPNPLAIPTTTQQQTPTNEPNVYDNNNRENETITLTQVINYPITTESNFVYDFCYSLTQMPKELESISLLLTFLKFPNEVDLSYTAQRAINYYGPKNYELDNFIVLHNSSGPQNNFSLKYLKNGLFEGRIYTQTILSSSSLLISGSQFFLVTCLFSFSILKDI